MKTISNAELAAGFRAHGQWLRETTAEVDQLLVEVELCPMAELLLALHVAGVMGEKFHALNEPVEPRWQCGHCHSPRTRLKNIQPIYDSILGPLIGVQTRCRVCGGRVGFLADDPKERIAA